MDADTDVTVDRVLAEILDPSPDTAKAQEVFGLRIERARLIAHELMHVRRLVAAAREIHVPNDELDCVGCGRDAADTPQHWPCATAKALGTPRAQLTVRWD